MQIDLVRIFPLSCEKKGYKILIINTEDIVKAERSALKEGGLDAVQVGGILYKFEPEDNGLLHLNNIMLAEKVNSFLTNNPMQIDESNMKDITDLCKNTLNSYQMLLK